MGQLEGRTALVTGASWGIGAAVARGLAEHGARVVVNHLGDDRMTRLAHDVVTSITDNGGSAMAFAADVSDRSQVDAMTQATAERFGGIDILVNNAAAQDRKHFSEITEEEWNQVLAVNLTGPLLLTQAVFPHMREQGYGKIINVTSVTVELGHTPLLHYVTTKAGLIGFTRSLAREAGVDGIRVNAVMPGAIRTEQELETFPGQDDQLRELLAERQCLGYRGTADDLVGAFVYLASPASDFVTGQVLTVDGGWIHY